MHPGKMIIELLVFRQQRERLLIWNNTPWSKSISGISPKPFTIIE